MRTGTGQAQRYFARYEIGLTCGRIRGIFADLHYLRRYQATALAELAMPIFRCALHAVLQRLLCPELILVFSLVCLMNCSVWGGTQHSWPGTFGTGVAFADLPDDADLHPGTAATGVIDGALDRTYYLSLEESDCALLQLVVKSAEAIIEITGIDGHPVFRTDTSDGTGGPIRIYITAQTPGKYAVRLRPSQPRATAGTYQLTLQELRPATDRDRQIEKGQKALREAEVLRSQDTLEMLQAAAEKSEEALKIWEDAGYPEGIAEARSLFGDILGDLGQNQRALEELQRSHHEFQQLGDRAGIATTGDLISLVYFQLGNLKPAMQLVTEDRAVWLELGDQRREAHTLTYMGTLAFTLGDSQKALGYFGDALPLRREAADLRGEAETLNEMGVVYDNSGETQEALQHFNQALEIRRQIGYVRGEAATLFNIGTLYAKTGDLHEANKYFSEALPLRRKVGNKTGEALTLIRMGAVEVDLGNEQSGLDLYRQALAVAREVKNQRVEALALGSLGATYLALGDAERALDYSNQALALFRAVPDRRGEANTLRTIGGIYMSLGEPKHALERYTECLALQRASTDKRGEGATLNAIGEAYAALGDPGKAQDALTQALAMAENTDARDLESIALRNLGKTQLLLGDNVAALDFYNRALTLQSSLGNRPAELSTLYGIAQADKALGDLKAAQAHCEAALAIIESLRTHISSRELRTSYFATEQQPYELYIDVLMELHRNNPQDGYDVQALEAAERARARTMLDMLAEARADIHRGVDPQLVQREHSLQQAIEAKSARQVRVLSSKHTEQQAAIAKSELEKLLREYQDLEEQIRVSSPRYASLTQPEPLSLKEMQHLLDSDTVLLEYSIGTQRSYVWAITENSLSSFELPGSGAIEPAARQLYDTLTARNRQVKGETKQERYARIAAADVAYPKAVDGLSRMVIAPLGHLVAKKRLVVIATGALQYVPFGVLTEPTAGESQVENAHFSLVSDHEVITAPSASLLLSLRTESRALRATKSVALFADPVFDSDDERVKKLGVATTTTARTKPVSGKSQPASTLMKQEQLTRAASDMGMSQVMWLNRLPFTRREAAAIIAVTAPGTSTQALDFRASRAVAISSEMSQYRILHFATHGILDTEHPELSGLVLSLVNEQGMPENGFLELEDIYNLNLNAELVVMSACDTALGKEIKGEGLVGLTRGFMYAGVPRVVASLWKVDDVATAELMGRFYKAMLVQRLRPAAALREAQFEMLKQKRWASPYYWAAFTLQGEWR